MMRFLHRLADPSLQDENRMLRQQIADDRERFRKGGYLNRQLRACVQQMPSIDPRLCICTEGQQRLWRSGAIRGPDQEVGTADDLPMPEENPKLCYCGFERWTFYLNRDDLGEDGVPNTSDDDPMPNWRVP